LEAAAGAAAAGVSLADVAGLLGLGRVRAPGDSHGGGDALVSHLVLLEIDRGGGGAGGGGSGGSSRGGGNVEASGGGGGAGCGAASQALRARVVGQVNVTTRGVYATQSIFGLQTRRTPSVVQSRSGGAGSENGVGRSGSGSNSSSGAGIEAGSGSVAGGSSSGGSGEEESGECVVCLTDRRDTVLLPCRHLCVCQACFLHLDKCPVCRAPFDTHVVFEHSSSGDEKDDGGGDDKEEKDEEEEGERGPRSPGASAVLTTAANPFHADSQAPYSQARPAAALSAAHQENRVHEALL
jgi:hypothetical protein